jgi:hypothetical protein
MGLLRLSGFSGEWPIRDPRALPDNAALSAINVQLDGGAYLKGSRFSIPIKTLFGVGINTVFRVPLPGANTLANSYWREFTDENTNVFRSPLVNDSFERIFWGSPTDGLQYLPKTAFIAERHARLHARCASPDDGARNHVSDGRRPRLDRDARISRYLRQQPLRGKPAEP